jgi:pimeloyl-ACP methyl ester carboxylesterase
MLMESDRKPCIAHLDRGAGDPVVLVHCSASSGKAWASLIEVIGGDFRVLVPDQWGCGFSDPWIGEEAFTLADEAGPIIELIEQAGRPIHLVGHSYGGGVALHIAHHCPDLIESLVLIEPSAFQLLRRGSDTERERFREIHELASALGRALTTGSYWEGMQRFVDYWGGGSVWSTMTRETRITMSKRLSKVVLDFRALFEEPSTIADFRSLPFPVLMICGDLSPAPSRRIVDLLSAAIPRAQIVRIPGAGHMSPRSHSLAVNAVIAAHLKGWLTGETADGWLAREAEGRWQLGAKAS